VFIRTTELDDDQPLLAYPMQSPRDIGSVDAVLLEHFVEFDIVIAPVLQEVAKADLDGVN